jgi:1-acyl-sn-glycerol-3-phosphate acyltransferase
MDPLPLLLFFTSCYEIFNRYYFSFFFLFLLFTSTFGLLRGKGSLGSQPLLMLILYRLIIILFYWVPVYNFSPRLSLFFLGYLLTFLNFKEFYGSSTLYLRNGFLSILPLSLKSYFGCRLIKTASIKKQCILALHPHGVLPYCTCVNIVTEVNQFSELYPDLSNRVLVVASALMVIPFLRDLLLSYGIIDASRTNFERWLEKKHTVAVYVGGAHEALYANSSADILDLKRKTGFMKLAMKYGVPVVPCYTFNEVNHYRQIPFPSLLKFPFLTLLRNFIHSSTGLCLPILVSFVPSKQNEVVTVIGKPLYPLKKKSLDENMERYQNALQKLYLKHAPKYNSQQRELKIIS